MSASAARVTVDPAGTGPVISRHLFGHFAEHLGRCIYDGVWVGPDSTIPHVRGLRADVVAALRGIRVPNLRWPGGCFADDYHWRHGVGPVEQRPRRLNAWWGGVIEDNRFGTLEFLDLCEQAGCEPYICGNVGSGTVPEMRDWVEYLNAPAGSLAEERARHGHPAPARVRLWAVGNESWGCGGTMRPEFYADQFRRYATFLRDYEGAPLFRVACGPNGDDTRWTEVMMRECGAPRFHPEIMHGLALHYYAVGAWPPAEPAVGFDEAAFRRMLAEAWKMDDLVRQHRAVMDRFDPRARVALVVDEWGAWYAAEPGTNPRFLFQRQTARDAVIAGHTLHAFIAHAERVRMANLAQLVNVLQCVLMTDGDRLVRTPTWHAFALMVPHHDATRLPVAVDAGEITDEAGRSYPRLTAAASRAADGSVTLTLSHGDPAAPLELELPSPAGLALRSAAVVAGPGFAAENTFAAPDTVAVRPWPGVTSAAGAVRAVLPPAAVASLTFA